MSEEDVRSTIIEPMRLTWLPPRHLRTAPDGLSLEEMHEAVFGQYVDALGRFDTDTLEKAWQRVRDDHEYSIWPTPAKFVKAAKAAQPNPPPDEAQIKCQEAKQMADAYVRKFMASRRKIVAEAREKGFAGYLLEYVQATAWIQAQWICGLNNVSFSARVISVSRHHGSSEAILEEYRKTLPDDLKEISVSIPKARVEAWREVAQETDPPLSRLESLQERLRNSRVSPGR